MFVWSVSFGWINFLVLSAWRIQHIVPDYESSIPFPGVNFINFLRPTSNSLHPTPNFWEDFYWRKILVQGAKVRHRVQNSSWNQSQANSNGKYIKLLFLFKKLLFVSWYLTRYQTKPHWVMLMGIESHGRSKLVTWYTYHGNHRMPSCKIEQNSFFEKYKCSFFQKLKFLTNNYI